jgi:hypothetical protein
MVPGAQSETPAGDNTEGCHIRKRWQSFVTGKGWLGDGSRKREPEPNGARFVPPSKQFGGINMTYEDPRSGRERNLGQDDVGTSTGSWIAGIIVLAAIALGGWYFYNHSQRVADVNHPATSAADNGAMKSSPTSGPGVQGSAGSTNGPAAQPNSNSSTGASTGTSGSNPNIDKTTVPAQDATGVKGAEGSTNGPAPKQ